MAHPAAAQSSRALSINDPAVETVRTWRDLRGEPKWAWLYLWLLADCRPGCIIVHPGCVGEFQGTSEKAGRNALNNLAAHGLIQVLERGALWTIYLEDPVEVARARLVRSSTEEQGELYEPGTPLPSPPEIRAIVKFDGKPTAEAPSLPPSQGGEESLSSTPSISAPVLLPPFPVPCDGGSDGASAVGLQNVGSAQWSGQKAVRSSTVTLTQPDDSEPKTAAEIFPDVSARIKERAATEIEKGRIIAEEILRAVDEPSLPRWICEEIGQAIAQGIFSRGRLDSKLKLLRTKREQWAEEKRSGKNPEGDTGMRRRNYFTTAMRYAFEDVGLRLFDSKKTTVANDGGEIPC